jgi:hypothetical protein
MPPALAPPVLPLSFRESSDRKFSADRRSEPVHGFAAADARRAGSSAFAVSGFLPTSPGRRPVHSHGLFYALCSVRANFEPEPKKAELAFRTARASLA